VAKVKRRKAGAVTVEQKELLADLDRVKSAVAKADYQPALQGVLVRGKYMTAYDSTVVVMVPCDYLPLTMLPRFDMLYSVVRAVKGSIEMSVKGDKLSMKVGRYRTTLHLMDPDAYPPVPVRGGTRLDLPEDFFDGLRKVIPFASANVSRPELCGVHVQGKWLEAADGMRLARYEMDDSIDTSLTIPVEAVNVLLSMGDEAKNIFVKDDAVFGATYEHGIFASHVLSASYPETHGIFRDASKEGFEIEFGDEAGDAAMRVGLLAPSNDYRVKVSSTTKAGRGQIEARAEGLGQSSETIAAKADDDFEFLVMPSELCGALDENLTVRYAPSGKLYSKSEDGKFEQLISLVVV